jgi:hypothetical protein
MVIVAVVLAVIFLFRDLQILVVQDRRLLAVRFGIYALLLVTGLAIFAEWAGSGPAWTEPLFARGAIFVQLLELTIGMALHRYALGRYGWIGCVLPAPAFLFGLCTFGLEVQGRLQSDASSAMELVTGAWLLVVGVLAVILYRMNNPWEDRKFAREFAMMSSCTALIFAPFWLS